MDQGSGTVAHAVIEHGPPPVFAARPLLAPDAPRVNGGDVVAAFSDARKAAGGGPAEGKQTDYQRREDAAELFNAEAARLGADAPGLLAGSVANFIADPKMRAQRWPWLIWLADPGAWIGDVQATAETTPHQSNASIVDGLG